MDALRRMVERLKDDPLTGAIPITTRNIRRRFLSRHRMPLFVRFVVYQYEHVVTIYEIKPLPGSPVA